MSRRRRTPASSASGRPTARMTSAAQFVASVPHQLGFTPTESLVVVCCHEPRGRVGLTLRIDLPGEPQEPALVDQIVARVRQEQATRVIVAVYTDEGGELPRRNLVDDLRLQLDDLVVTEALLVRGGRFWSYVCFDPRCCPADGRSIDEAVGSAPVQLIAAEGVMAGRAVLPDRAAVAASLAGPTFLAAEAARRTCEDALDAFEGERPGSAARARAIADWRVAVERYRTPPASVSDTQAARLAMTLHRKPVRDEVALWVVDDEEPLLALLGDLCRRTPAPYDAPVATLLGWLTYAVGGGAVVMIAAERALRSDPDYSMAHLLLDLCQAQVRPAKLKQLLLQEAERTRRAS